jgi:hypothetical protein
VVPAHTGAAIGAGAAAVGAGAAISPSWLPLNGRASNTEPLPSPFLTTRSPGGGAGSKCHRRNCDARARSGANRCFHCGKCYCPKHSRHFQKHQSNCSLRPQKVEPLSASGTSAAHRNADRHAEDLMTQEPKVKLARRMQQIQAADGQGLYTLLEVVDRQRAVTFDLAKGCGLFDTILKISSESRSAQMAHLATAILLRWLN